MSALGDRASASEAAADRAEEEASVAMRSAETGVREEMEAEAVVKETESALSKALAELTFLETSYEEKDFESKAEKAKAKEKAQKEAEIAVRDALAAVNKTVQSPEAEGGLGKHSIQLFRICLLCFSGHSISSYGSKDPGWNPSQNMVVVGVSIHQVPMSGVASSCESTA